MNDLLTRLWRLGKPLQWRFLWLVHAKFICGITGVVRDDHGRVLLLRHRLWPPGRQWGFPTGYASKGERHEDTIAREVREETGLTVKAGRLLKVRSGFQYRIEVYYEAVLVGGLDGLTLDPKEVLEARLFSPGDLPDGMPEAHRELSRVASLRPPPGFGGPLPSLRCGAGYGRKSFWKRARSAERPRTQCGVAPHRGPGRCARARRRAWQPASWSRRGGPLAG